MSRIAQMEGYNSPQAVNRVVRRALARMESPEAETRRQRDTLMLHAVLERQWELVDKEYFLTAASVGMVTDLEGNPIRDYEPVRKALADVVKTQARLAALWGLDAPMRQRIEFIEPEQVLELIRQTKADTARMKAEMASGNIIGRIGIPDDEVG